MVLMDGLFFSTLYVDFVEGSVNGVGEYCIGKYNNVIVVFLGVAIV